MTLTRGRLVLEPYFVDFSNMLWISDFKKRFAWIVIWCELRCFGVFAYFEVRVFKQGGVLVLIISKLLKLQGIFEGWIIRRWLLFILLCEHAVDVAQVKHTRHLWDEWRFYLFALKCIPINIYKKWMAFNFVYAFMAGTEPLYRILNQ